MKVDLDRQGLEALLKGTVVPHELMTEPRIKLCGEYLGGFADRWQWSSVFPTELTDNDLWDMYNKIKDFWSDNGCW